MGIEWIVLVAGTQLGVLSLSADLLGVGAFPGFGWKQILGTATALIVVLSAGWRIYRRSRGDRP